MTMQRTSSSQSSVSPEAGSSRRWKIGSSIRRKASVVEEDNTAPETTPAEPAIISSHNDSNHRQLRELVQRMRAAPQNPIHVDAAFREYAKIREQCAALVRALLSPAPSSTAEARYPIPEPSAFTAPRASPAPPPRRPAHRKAESAYAQIGVVPWRNPSNESLPDPAVWKRASIGGGVADAPSASGSRTGVTTRPGPRVNGAYLGVIRDWKTCLEQLADQHRECLERDPWPDIGDALERDKRFRVTVALRSKSEARLRNYEAVKAELAEVGALLQAGESGISLDREIREYVIAPRGDAVLEWANTKEDWKPVLRVRVSSHMLSETSPIFARMFLGGSAAQGGYDDGEDIQDTELPPPAVDFVGPDGVAGKLYRMPQTETNREEALTLLLHAAHMHNDRVPRDISFERFVAVAEVCLRYRCTSPLEVFVEHRWLPQWMHKATEEMPDGLLLISYAFGIRRLFTRMTKTVIMNTVCERDIYEKNWPSQIKERIRAICSAKRAQIYQACLAAVDEYLRPPPPPPPVNMEPVDVLLPEQAGITDEYRESMASTLTGSPPRPISRVTTIMLPPPPTGRLMLSSTPRCPKGSHWCDATNLGWLMLVLNELQLLNTVLRPAALPTHPTPPPRSLAQLVSVLSTVPSPPHPVHAAQRMGGVCDPAPAFRSAVNDIYNSVSGLTLFDIAGRHGWALSRHKRDAPQAVLRLRLNRGRKLVLEEAVCLALLGQVETLGNLRALALVNRGLWYTYKKYEVGLLGRLVGVGGVRLGPEKVLREDLEVFADAEGREDVENATSELDDEASVDSEAETEVLTSEFTMVQASETTTPMTDEEARKILWPDSDVEPPPPVVVQEVRVGIEGNREKLRADDAVFIEGKTLVVADGKQLREERDRIVGLIPQAQTQERELRLWGEQTWI